MSKEFVKDGKIVTEKDALDELEVNSEIELNFVPIKELSYKQNNGFGTYICEMVGDEDIPDTFSLKGTFVKSLDIGQSYKGFGVVTEWRGKKQFQVNNIKKIMPKGKRNTISFLKSLDGMKYQADIIWDMYEENSLNIIRESPLVLMGVINGAYPEMLFDWQNQILNLRDDFDILNDLINLGIRSDQGKILYNKYGAVIFQKLSENPYFLSREISGYGFKKCDAVARKMGIDIKDTNRIKEGIIYLLKEIENDGHLFIFKDILISSAKDFLSLKMSIPEMKKAIKSLNNNVYVYNYGEHNYLIDGDLIRNNLISYNYAYSKAEKEKCKIVIDEVIEDDILAVLKILEIEERIIIENDKIYRKEMYDKEISIAYFISEIKKKARSTNIDANKLLNAYCRKYNLELETKQYESVVNCISSFGDIGVINGAAGCGKTFCIKIVLELLELIYINKYKYFEKIIVAPTGKASKVAHKATGIEATTIHKLLKPMANGGFFYNINNKLPYDCIVIDESSMIDCYVAYHLFSAISPNTKVLMMGDTNQLASIGPGNIFHDIINSNVVNVNTLNVIKRQGLDSGIVTNSHNVINNKMICSNKELKDFLIYKGNDDDDYIKKVLKQSDVLIDKYGLSGFQILSPQRTGIMGTNYLNYLLQQRYNLNKSNKKILKQICQTNIDGNIENFELYFKIGDKVINTKNNYDMPNYFLEENQLFLNKNNTGITNGEMGVIIDIFQNLNEFNEWNNSIVVEFEDKIIIYENDFDNLELCYAMTIHKSQGSEWPGVLVALHPSQKYMLDKNILYTAITRAKKTNVLISDEETIKYSIATNKVSKRNTGLCEKIKKINNF